LAGVSSGVGDGVAADFVRVRSGVGDREAAVSGKGGGISGVR